MVCECLCWSEFIQIKMFIAPNFLSVHRPFKLNSFVILIYHFHQVFKIRSKECNTLSNKIIILYDYVVWFLLNCHSPTFQNFLHSKSFTYCILSRMASYIYIISLCFTILNSRRDTHTESVIGFLCVQQQAIRDRNTLIRGASCRRMRDLEAIIS